MAVIHPTIEPLQTVYGHTVLITWTNIGDSDTCDMVACGTYADRSVHVFGTFSSATITISGSNERAGATVQQTVQNGAVTAQSATLAGTASNFVGIHDPGGTAITFTAAGMKAIAESCQWIQPSTASGSGSSLTVALYCRSVL